MTDYCSEIAEAMRACRQLHLQCEAAPRGTPEYWKAYWAGRNTAAHGDELRRNAAKEFAALNGWRHTERAFSIKTLIRGGTHATRDEWPIYLDPHSLLDHPVYFREMPKPYRPTAIVGQPYDTSVAKGTELAHSLGLELHAPPNFTASWWYPNHARFFCLTRPGVAVQFLPDQLTFESPRGRGGGVDTVPDIQALSIDCNAQARVQLEKLLGPATVVTQSDETFNLYYRLTTPAKGINGQRKLKQMNDLIAKVAGTNAQLNPKFCCIDYNTFLQMVGKDDVDAHQRPAG